MLSALTAARPLIVHRGLPPVGLVPRRSGRPSASAPPAAVTATAPGQARLRVRGAADTEVGLPACQREWPHVLAGSLHGVLLQLPPGVHGACIAR